MTSPANDHQEFDVLLIGAGIMSATLAVLLKLLEPHLRIAICERLDVAAAESSDAWNNAGTGHAAFCELNYTPEKPDGSIATAKALVICEAFEVSKQFWAALVERDILAKPDHFVTRIPHMSFVHDADGVEYLQRRYAALQQSPLFAGMQYSEDWSQLSEWMPVMMEQRERSETLAATHMAIGTDVNFGALTHGMITYLQDQVGVRVFFGQEVDSLDRDDDQRWRMGLIDRDSGAHWELRGAFVFIGAGGGALPLLQKSGIAEGRSYGGFPVSGQWLVCRNQALVERHWAKVYGRAAVGAPPMSVPHLDTRIIQGQRALLFGPYAGFSTRFLKHGSLLDLPLSVRASNVLPMLAAGLDNIALTKYLVEQVLQSPDDRLETLREFVPTAQLEDWELEVAGQRVQVIKQDDEQGGILEFGTELISAADGSLAALLGASPGASTAVSIMLGLLERCFPERLHSPEWQTMLRRLIPSYGQSLAKDAALLQRVRAQNAAVLAEVVI